ncbi:MAG TPA: DUF2752 domain-containing protein [Frankiaceae bacterium]|nr:DUF2752 domain-containing protein [Frankiaceae bacterium]
MTTLSATSGPPPLSRAVAATAVRVALAASAAVTLAAVRIERPPTLCLLRAVTGIPCPLCGTTTAAVHLGNGDVVAALLANPVALLLGLGLVLYPLIARGCHVPHRARGWLFTSVAAFAWVWQIVRFDRLAL